MAADPTLDPEGVAYFGASRRRVNDTYQLGVGQNDYQRQLGQLNYGQRMQALQDQYNVQQEAAPFGYAHRGVSNSGIYEHGQQLAALQQFNATNNLSQQQQMANQGFDLTGAQLASQQAGGLADLADQEQARRSALAAMLVNNS